jgi:hypothetical protein
MADTVAPTETQIALATYDRLREEGLKFAAEQHKLAQEAGKLQAEANKFNRDKWLVPLTALVTVVGAILAAVIARLPEILHVLGLGH